MRVALIGQRGVPAAFGGIERHVEEVGAGLAARGHDVTVFCRTNYGEQRPRTYRGMRLRHLPTVSTKHFDALVHSALATLATLGRGFDVVHYHALGPGALSPVARGLGRSVVVQTVHALDHDRGKWGAWARACLRGAAWMSARVPHATIVVSDALAEHYRRRYARQVVCIPNGVRPPGGRPPAREIARRFGLEQGSYLLFVGRMVPEKAPDLLVRAFREVPGDLRLVLAGESSFTDRYTAELRALAAADRRVIMTGYVYGETLAELYANARGFVLPSTLEGMPIVLLEAASYGTPVVASAIPPHLEVLGSDGPGHRLFPSGDQHALAAALTRLASDGSAEREGAARLRDRVLARHRWEDAVEATERLYERVLRDR